MKREAVGGIWNMLEMVLEARPAQRLQGETSLELPSVALHRQATVGPARGKTQDFQYLIGTEKWGDSTWCSPRGLGEREVGQLPEARV